MGLGFLGLILAGVTLVLVSIFGILGLGFVVGQLVPDRLKEALVLMAVTFGLGTWGAK